GARGPPGRCLAAPARAAGFRPAQVGGGRGARAPAPGWLRGAGAAAVRAVRRAAAADGGLAAAGLRRRGTCQPGRPAGPGLAVGLPLAQPAAAGWPGPAAGRRAGQRPAPASARPDHRLRRRRRLLIRPLVPTPGSDPLLRPRGQTPDSDPLLRPFTPTPVSGACDVPMAAARFECIPLPEGQLHLAAGWLGA